MTQDFNKKEKNSSLVSNNSEAKTKPFLKWLEKDKQDFKAAVKTDLLLAIKFKTFKIE